MCTGLRGICQHGGCRSATLSLLCATSTYLLASLPAHAALHHFSHKRLADNLAWFLAHAEVLFGSLRDVCRRGAVNPVTASGEPCQRCSDGLVEGACPAAASAAQPAQLLLCTLQTVLALACQLAYTMSCARIL